MCALSEPFLPFPETLRALAETMGANFKTILAGSPKACVRFPKLSFTSHNHSRIPKTIHQTASQGRAELIFGNEPSLPCRNSAPVSCMARRSAGQSSKSVAKIFWIMTCVSSGT
jgi:predicted amino acid racemase